MARLHVESRRDGTFGRGDEGDVGEEELVDGAVVPHGGPVFLNVKELVG